MLARLALVGREIGVLSDSAILTCVIPVAIARMADETLGVVTCIAGSSSRITVRSVDAFVADCGSSVAVLATDA